MNLFKNIKRFFSLFKTPTDCEIAVLQTFESREIEYAFLFVKGDTAEELNSNISSIIERAMKYEAVLDTISSNYLSFFFNAPVKIEKPKEKRLIFIDELTANDHSQFSLIHGFCMGSVGSFGTGYRLNYTALIPNYRDIMRELSMLEYGQVKRVDE